MTGFGNQGANYIKGEAGSRIDQIIAQGLLHNSEALFGSLLKRSRTKMIKSGKMNLQTQNLLDNTIANKLQR